MVGLVQSAMIILLACVALLQARVAIGWRAWDGATVGFSAGLCGTPNCGGSYTKSYNVQACQNAGYALLSDGSVQEPNPLPHPFGQGAQPALNECSNPGELRRDTCPNVLKFADVWQPNVDGRTFGGVGDRKLLQGFGHAFTKVADGLQCGGCAAVRAKRVLTDGGYNYMIIMRVDVTDDISPEVDEVTAEFGKDVVTQPAFNRIPYEYKVVDCQTGNDLGVGTPGAPPPPSPATIPELSPFPTPVPTLPIVVPSPVPGTSLRSCQPIGDCDASWCDQRTYTKWCSEAVDGNCPAVFCKLTGAVETPPSNPDLGDGSESLCVPSGEGMYSDKSLYKTICNVIMDASTCKVYPMCEWRTSLLLSEARQSRLRRASRHRATAGHAFVQKRHRVEAIPRNGEDRDSRFALVKPLGKSQLAEEL